MSELPHLANQMDLCSSKNYTIIIQVKAYPGGGGGTRLSFDGGGCRWGVKTWPCLKPLGAQKNTPCHNMHTLYWTGMDGLSILLCIIIQ